MLLKNNQYLTLFGQSMSNGQESIGIHFPFFIIRTTFLESIRIPAISCKSMSVHGATFADRIILPVDHNRTSVQRFHGREVDSASHTAHHTPIKVYLFLPGKNAILTQVFMSHYIFCSYWLMFWLKWLNLAYLV